MASAESDGEQIDASDFGVVHVGLIALAALVYYGIDARLAVAAVVAAGVVIFVGWRAVEWW